jgi:UDP-glucose 4-epimerase
MRACVVSFVATCEGSYSARPRTETFDDARVGKGFGVRVVVFGATGNVGAALVRHLAADTSVDAVRGVARRRPTLAVPKTEWVQADVATDDLEPLVADADVVVHLAWLIQPSRDERVLARVNVGGSARVFAAVAATGVPSLVYASSVGAYAPGPKDRLVDEGWPIGAVATSFYSRHKAEVERRLDVFEREHPGVRVVRLRPGLVFGRLAASGIRRLFAGPFLPTVLLRPRLIPLVPDIARLRFQAVHREDLADAYRRAILGDAAGAYNVAAEPVLDPRRLAEILDARRLRIRPGLARAAVGALWLLHLQPTPPGWLDLARAVPLLSTARIREELGWRPTVAADDALRELLQGMHDNAGEATPPLEPGAGGPLRLRELVTGIGRR